MDVETCVMAGNLSDFLGAEPNNSFPIFSRLVTRVLNGLMFREVALLGGRRFSVSRVAATADYHAFMGISHAGSHAGAKRPNVCAEAVMPLYLSLENAVYYPPLPFSDVVARRVPRADPMHVPPTFLM